MNIDIINIGHYRITSHGGRAHDMFNRQTDKVYRLTAQQFSDIRLHQSMEACMFVENVVSQVDNTTL